MRLVRYRGLFYAYWRQDVGNGRSKPCRLSLRTTERAEAERRLVDLARGLRAPATLVADIVERYIEDRLPSHPAGGERARYAWLRLKPVFGHLRPDQIDRPLCRAYAAARRRHGAQDGTIIKELSTLRAALRWQDRNTPAIVELPAEPAPNSRHLSREQYRALRDAAAAASHLEAFIVIGYTTAGRASAILELTWDRVDFVAGRIALGKGEQRRKGRATVPMTESAREILERVREGALTDYVVEYAGRPVSSVKRAFAAAATKAGVPWCTPHVLRHTAAVHMAERGVPIEEIAQYLGHTSPSVTYRVYARFSPEHLRRAAAALE